MEKDSGNRGATFWAAWSSLEIGTISTAESLFKRLGEPSKTKPWLDELFLGNLCLARFQPIEAELHFRSALDLAPTSTIPAVLLADCLIREEKLEQAAKVLIPALKWKGDVEEVCLNLGLVRRAQGRYEEAQVFLKKALDINGTYSEARAVLNDVNMCLGFSARHTKAKTEAISLARHADSKGHYAAAYELYREVFASDKGRISAGFRAAVNALDAWRISDSEGLLQAVLPVPDSQKALVENLFGRLRMARFKPQAAEVHFRRSWRLRPSSETGCTLADCLLKQERFEKTDELLKEILGSYSTSAESHRLMGALGRARSNYREAREHFARGLALDPECGELRSGLEDLDYLLSQKLAQSPARWE